MAARASERLAAARAEVERVCHMLVSPTPEQLDRCTERLVAATAEVKAWLECEGAAPAALRSTASGALTEARRLEKSLGRARRLLQGAAGFYEGWSQCQGALCAGYTDRGQAATVARGSRICARG